MKIFNKITPILLLLVLSGCSSYWEKQEEYLLPNSIERIDTEEIGIITYNYYKVDGEINMDSLANFPKNAMKGRNWLMKKWHKASVQELDNLKSFFEEEDINVETANRIIESIVQGDGYFIAYAHDNDEPSLAEKNYFVYNWMEFYYLDINNNKLAHISYGKF